MTKRSKFGWLNFILGLLFVALGILTFANPGIALSGLVAFYSIAAIISGISDIVFYIKAYSSTGFGPGISLVSGIISALAGLLLLLNPVLGKWIFSLGFPIWFIAHSISRLANQRFIRRVAGRAASITSIILNILGILLGVLMVIRPAVSVLSLGYLVASGLLVHGIGSIIEAFSRIGQEEDTAQWEAELGAHHGP